MDWIQAGEYYFPKLIFPSAHVFYVVSGGKFFVHAIDSFIYFYFLTCQLLCLQVFTGLVFYWSWVQLHVDDCSCLCKEKDFLVLLIDFYYFCLISDVIHLRNGFFPC